MRLSYFLTPTHRHAAIRGTLARLCEMTSLPVDQWEICLADSTDATVEYIRKELGNVQVTHGPLLEACNGQHVLPIDENTIPSGPIAIGSMLSHLEANPVIGAVVGRFVGGTPAPAMPTIVKLGSTCFRKTVLKKFGGLSSLRGAAADYYLSFRILSSGSRIDHREDILFQDESAGEDKPSDSQPPDVREFVERLNLLRQFLPQSMADIYWQDWSKKFKALSAQAGRRGAGLGGILLAKLKSLQTAYDGAEPVSDEVIESIFALRRQAALIGDWARRGSVWRVILADYSDNLWAVHNACRSSGLQMRCVADNNPAFANLSYRDLPIVPTTHAFEGGGIDGVILTSTEPSNIEANFRSLRNHFHGPILRLWQTARQATHVQAAAA